MFCLFCFTYFQSVKSFQIVFSHVFCGRFKMCRTDSRDVAVQQTELQPGALSDWKTSGSGDLAMVMMAHRVDTFGLMEREIDV